MWKASGDPAGKPSRCAYADLQNHGPISQSLLKRRFFGINEGASCLRNVHSRGRASHRVFRHGGRLAWRQPRPAWNGGLRGRSWKPRHGESSGSSPGCCTALLLHSLLKDKACCRVHTGGAWQQRGGHLSDSILMRMDSNNLQGRCRS